MDKNEYLQMIKWILEHFPEKFDEGFDAMYKLWKFQKDLTIIAENHIGVLFLQP